MKRKLARVLIILGMVLLGIAVCDLAIKHDSKSYEKGIKTALIESTEKQDIVYSTVSKERTSPISFQYKIIVKRSANSPKETVLINKNFIYPDSNKLEFVF